MNETSMLRAGFVFLLAAAGCSSSTSGSGVTSGSGDDGGPTPADGSPGIDSAQGVSGQSDSASPPQSLVRVAHLAPDAPAVDFCLAAHGSSTFAGPVLAGAGVASGLPYSKVTKYLPVAAAQYDVRLVAPGSTSCATPLAGLHDFTDLPSLPAGGNVTIAAEGELANGSANPFGLRAYVDDSAVASGKAKLRFIHASPGTPAVDVGLGGGVLFTSVFTNVAFGIAPSTANGYVETAPFANAEVSARAHGTSADVLSISGATLPAGAIATAFAIGKIGSTASPLKVLLCVDNAMPTGALGACSVVGDAPKRAHIRIAHLSPDAPAVDACIAPAGTTSFAGPLLRALGATAGLAYPQVTSYVDLPVAKYDLRIVVASATDCSTKAVPDTTGVMVTDGLSATIAAVGDLTVADAGSDPSFKLAVLVDDATAASGKGALRFVHASPGTPAVDVGLGTGASFSDVFTNVAFGMTAASSSSIDANGYYGGTFSNQTVTARVHGSTSDALSVPGVSLTAGEVATAFAIGGKTGSATNPLRVLLCIDKTAPTTDAGTPGLLAACQ